MLTRRLFKCHVTNQQSDCFVASIFLCSECFGWLHSNWPLWYVNSTTTRLGVLSLGRCSDQSPLLEQSTNILCFIVFRHLEAIIVSVMAWWRVSTCWLLVHSGLAIWPVPLLALATYRIIIIIIDGWLTDWDSLGDLTNHRSIDPESVDFN